MAEAQLHEKDPQIVAVVDKSSGRNLLDPADPSPLSIDLSGGKPRRAALQIHNGPEGLINLAIDSDQTWMNAEPNRLTLIGGESGDCVVTATPSGNGEYATLLLTWDGSERTLSQHVMVVRTKGGQSPPPSGDASTNRDMANGRTNAVKRLEKVIDGYGGNDKFIDYEEEQQIFRKGGELELSLPEIEAILNRKCSEGGWTRQTRLTEKLTAMLEEATKDDGVIDQQEFEHIVNFAVKRMMPRRDADEHCITLTLNNAWRAKEGVLKKWFTKKRKHYGL